MTIAAPSRACLTAGHVAFGEYRRTTLDVYFSATFAAASARSRYRSVAAPAGPTIRTTFGCGAATATPGSIANNATRRATIDAAARMNPSGLPSSGGRTDSLLLRPYLRISPHIAVGSPPLHG